MFSGYDNNKLFYAPDVNYLQLTNLIPSIQNEVCKQPTEAPTIDPTTDLTLNPIQFPTQDLTLGPTLNPIQSFQLYHQLMILLHNQVIFLQKFQLEILQ